MKKYILLIVLLPILFACQTRNGQDIEIGFLIHSTSSSRWKMDIAYIIEKANEIGVEVILKNAEGDENVQLKQARELLEDGVDALIVVAANQNTAAGIVRDAHRYNVPVIAYDRLIKNSDLDYLVSFEYDKVGQLMVEYAISKKPQGNYMIFYGDPGDANALFVKDGIEKALKPHIESGNVNVVYETFIEGWKQTNSNYLANKVLDFTDKRIDAAIVCNDPMAVGVYQAFEAHGYAPNEVTITGQDATLQFVHSMLEGGVTMSIAKPIKELAYGSVEMVVKLLREEQTEGFDKVVNNGRKDVPSKLFEPYVIDMSNMPEEIIQSGVYSKEEVYGNTNL